MVALSLSLSRSVIFFHFAVDFVQIVFIIIWLRFRSLIRKHIDFMLEF